MHISIYLSALGSVIVSINVSVICILQVLQGLMIHMSHHYILRYASSLVLKHDSFRSLNSCKVQGPCIVDCAPKRRTLYRLRLLSRLRGNFPMFGIDCDWMKGWSILKWPLIPQNMEAWDCFISVLSCKIIKRQYYASLHINGNSYAIIW